MDSSILIFGSLLSATTAFDLIFARVVTLQLELAHLTRDFQGLPTLFIDFNHVPNT